MCDLKHSGDGSTAKVLLGQSIYPQIKFLAQCFGVGAQVLNGFGFQKWGDLPPRHQMGRLKKAAAQGKLLSPRLPFIRPAGIGKRCC